MDRATVVQEGREYSDPGNSVNGSLAAGIRLCEFFPPDRAEAVICGENCRTNERVSDSPRRADSLFRPGIHAG